MSLVPTKSERMEMRKAIGNRVVQGAPALPSHRGPDYLVAHACFCCRKSWKLPEKAKGVCGECGKLLHWMGRAFKAPKKSDVEQWKKVEALWRAGFRFFSHTHGGEVEPYPERFKEVEEFVRKNQKHPFRVIG